MKVVAPIVTSLPVPAAPQLYAFHGGVAPPPDPPAVPARPAILEFVQTTLFEVLVAQPPPPPPPAVKVLNAESPPGEPSDPGRLEVVIPPAPPVPTVTGSVCAGVNGTEFAR